MTEEVRQWLARAQADADPDPALKAARERASGWVRESQKARR